MRRAVRRRSHPNTVQGRRGGSRRAVMQDRVHRLAACQHGRGVEQGLPAHAGDKRAELRFGHDTGHVI